MIKNFYKKLLFFCLFGVAVFCSMEILARLIYLKSSPVKGHIENIDRSIAKATFLVLGSSHAETGIRMKFFSKPGTNLAFSAQDLYFNLELLKRAMMTAKSASTLLFCIDLNSFGYDESTTSRHLVNDYYRFAGIAPRNGFSLGFLVNYSDLFVHRRGFFPDLFERSFRRGKTGRNLPSLPQSADRTDDPARLLSLELNGRERAAFHQQVYLVEKEEENRKLVDETIILARQSKMKVILLSPPMMNSYRSNLAPAFLDRFYRLLALVFQEHPGQGLVYYDFSTSTRFLAEHFSDSDHLNLKGASIWSGQLNNLLFPGGSTDKTVHPSGQSGWWMIR